MQRLHPRAPLIFFCRYIQSRPVLGFLIILYVVFLAADQYLPIPFPELRLLGYSIVPSLLIIILLWAELVHFNYRYEITDHGFEKQYGVFHKRSVTIPFNKIQNIDIDRTVLHRILGLSDLHIQTAGASALTDPIKAAEGYLPGLGRGKAEELRAELLKQTTGQNHTWER